MDAPKLQLTPELRQALQASAGEPLHIEDDETKKVYLIVEEGVVPTLDEAYIREGLQLARQQIARGEVSERTIDEVIVEAERRNSNPT